MTPQARRNALIATIALSTIVLALFLASDVRRDPERPDDAQALAQWLAARPADWIAASALTDRSLDSELPRRIELWRAGYLHAEQLAPTRPNTAAGFVRAGLFHWQELAPADRKAVLDVAATLMQEPRVFDQMHVPLWQLTRDFAYLRRVAPRTINALSQLRDLAVTHGLFDHYRELRTELRRARLLAFMQRRRELATTELLMYLPSNPDTSETPLVRAILEELNDRAFDPHQAPAGVDGLAEFAIEHGVQPLAGLSAFIDAPNVLRDVTRARLALALGDRTTASRIELTTAVLGSREWIPYYRERAAYEAERGDAGLATTYRDRAAFALRNQPPGWIGLCSQDLCQRAWREHEGPLQLEASVVQTDEVPVYLEIYADGALVAEGAVSDEKTFAIDAGAGGHRIEVRLVNERTRNGIQRRARLS